MLWFVIPVGAIFSGFVAAGGYYLGSILFGHKPTWLLLIHMVLVSVATYFAINWLRYMSTETDGRLLSDLIPFSQYMDIILRHQTMELLVHGTKVGTTGELGGFGYATAALQIIGFAIGGAVIFTVLSTRPYCEKCRKFLKAGQKQVRYAAEPGGFMTMVKDVAAHFDSDRLQEAIENMAASERQGNRKAAI